ncbi:sigma-70 family RNA polymerase sigma factor [Mangrovihabitans endophyticus]|uniref:DNA-directed RNA polymerase sigma-70 factor n=1 Tax=Mangrovihabitans endophyticus TaxID=1751298 RepID=A0A8J3C8E8_9ACTN|nr:sigma-70 family RNA polymerase sigma factor [Mangrovihabitans endophyticus]GGL20065.1 DNA-directed RNA polymerase sigma-70 factor [Mangrovihabitans endophyticus]
MTESNRLVELFEQHRGRLRAVAYRILGSSAEADDALQEAWLRLSAARSGEIDNLGGWLTTVVAHECLRMLRSRRRRAEQPLSETAAGDDLDEVVLTADAVGRALMIVLDTLTPAERVAFVLHDVFEMSFDEIAPIVDRTSAATRQLASRARRRVRAAAPAKRTDLARQQAAVDAFLVAVSEGDLDALLGILHPDVVLRDDRSAAPQMRGAQAVAAYAAGFRRGAPFARPALVCGRAGLALIRHGHVIGGLGFVVDDGIVVVEVISNPAEIGVPDSPGKSEQCRPRERSVDGSQSDGTP